MDILIGLEFVIQWYLRLKSIFRPHMKEFQPSNRVKKLVVGVLFTKKLGFKLVMSWSVLSVTPVTKSGFFQNFTWIFMKK